MNFFFEWKILSPDNIKVTDWIIAVGSIIGPVATFLAVFVALYKKKILNHCNGPKLEVTIKKEQPYILNIPQSCETNRFENMIGIKNKANGNSIYLRFQVSNNGKSLAKNVAVFVKEIRGGKVPRRLDMYLNPENIGINHNIFPNIPSKTGRYWDFGIITDPKYRKNDTRYFLKEKWDDKYTENEPALLISVTYQLATGYHIFGHGNYEVDILIVADQIEPIKKTILIDTSKFEEWPIAGKKIEEEEKEISAKIIFKVKNENR